MNDDELMQLIRLSFVPNLGLASQKKLLHLADSEPSKVFSLTREEIVPHLNISKTLFKELQSPKHFRRAEEEMKFIKKYNINVIDWKSSRYPYRLKACPDAPLVLFTLGDLDLNQKRVVSVIGSRNASPYGKDFCEGLIKDLQSYGVIVISGLAYGIDYIAHRSCIDLNVPTAAVLGHGLDKIYPSAHKKLANSIAQDGLLLTEFTSKSSFNNLNFPRRNRIVAGISDAVVVVESAKKGGALITAEMASSYHRDVFAVPGNVDSKYSEGCNMLIKSHKASLLSSASDLSYIMNWKAENRGIQMQIFESLSADEDLVYKFLKSSLESKQLEYIQFNVNLSISKLLIALMNLELKGLIKSLPGKKYSSKV